MDKKLHLLDGQDHHSSDSVVTGSKKAVYTALVGNLGIAVAKLIAAILTGSIAMLAETLHSFSDTFNQVLLLFGIKTSTKDCYRTPSFRLW